MQDATPRENSGLEGNLTKSGLSGPILGYKTAKTGKNPEIGGKCEIALKIISAKERSAPGIAALTINNPKASIMIAHDR